MQQVSESELARQIFVRLTGQEPPAGIRPFRLHPKQEQFVQAEEHHVAYIGGIGSGKTHSGVARALRASYGWIGNQRIPTPNWGLITAPTYPLLRDVTMRTWIELAEEHVPGFRADMVNRGYMTARLPNGSVVLFRSATKMERLRALNLSWWYGDEAGLYAPGVREIALGRLREHGRLGYEWVTATPKGKNWMYKAYAQEEQSDYRLVHSTSRENTFLGNDVLEMWEREYTGDFARQELKGEFVAFEGLIYAEFDRTRHVSRTRPERFARVIAGVDWGYANPGVIVVIGVDGDGRIYVLAEAYERRRRVEEWVNVAAQMRETWGITQFVCDPSEPDYIRAFREKGLKAEAADNSVLPGIQAVQDTLARGGDGRPRLTVSPDCANLLSEIEQYQWAENRHGVRDAPVKANDHAMDALRYAIMAASAKPMNLRTTVKADRYA